MPLLAGHEARHWIAPTTAPRGSNVLVANGVAGACDKNDQLNEKKVEAAKPAGITANVIVKVESSSDTVEEKNAARMAKPRLRERVKVEGSCGTGGENAFLNVKPRLQERVKVEDLGETGGENAVLNEKPRPQENAARIEKPRPTESRKAPPLDMPKSKKRRRAEPGSCHDDKMSTPTAAISKNSGVGGSVANHGANRQGSPCETVCGGVTLGSEAGGRCGGSSLDGGGKGAGEVIGTESAQGMSGRSGPGVWGVRPRVGRGGAGVRGGGADVEVTSAPKEENGVSTAIEMMTPRRSKRIRTPKVPYTGL